MRDIVNLRSSDTRGNGKFIKKFFFDRKIIYQKKNEHKKKYPVGKKNWNNFFGVEFM